MPSLYKLDYDGTGVMTAHDSAAELRRWFDNYKLDRDAAFASEYEWLTIEEKKSRPYRRLIVRYVGTIGDVDMERPGRRKVLFETNAPPPPTFHRPAKHRPAPEPKPVNTDGVLTIDKLFALCEDLGIDRAQRYAMMRDTRSPYEMMDKLRFETLRREEERFRLSAMNWLLPIRAQDHLILGVDFAETAKPKLPPPKRYRRN